MTFELEMERVKCVFSDLNVAKQESRLANQNLIQALADGMLYRLLTLFFIPAVYISSWI